MNEDLSDGEIVEQLPRGVIVLDADSTVRRINFRARELLQASYGHAVQPGVQLLSVVGELEQARWIKLLRGAFRGNDVQGEVKRVLADGTAQVLRIDAQLMSAEPRVLAIVEDVSVRRLYESELLGMHAALREANRTRDTILSIIGHDLRSPIAQLNALMYMLRYSPEELDKEKMNSYAGTLEESTRYLSATLNNLLTWSSLHRDSIEPQFQKVDLVAVAGEALGLLQLDAARKDVKLLHECPPELFVTTDRDLMAYVIRNLVANAIKFSSPGSGVRVVHSAEADGGYQLRVIDQGVGMQTEQVERVLLGGNLATTVGTLGEKGFGLGLSLAREFIAMLKGRIEIESIPDEGTTVLVSLPPRSADEENSL